MLKLVDKKIFTRPNKKSVFQVTGLKILGRIGTNIFFHFFSEKNIMHFERHFGKKYNFMHFERYFAFQNA